LRRAARAKNLDVFSSAASRTRERRRDGDLRVVESGVGMARRNIRMARRENANPASSGRHRMYCMMASRDVTFLLLEETVGRHWTSAASGST